MTLNIGSNTVVNNSPNVSWTYIASNSKPYFLEGITITGTGTTTCYANTLPSSFSITTQEGTVQGIYFSNTGNKLFAVGSTADRVFEYTLSSSWDITTASLTGNVSISTQSPTSGALFFKPDGTKMFIAENGATDYVYEYSLSTAWQVNTATFTTGANISINTQETDTRGLFFKDDGTKMYIVGTTNDRVFEYALSTAWQVNTATATVGANVSVNAQDGNPYDLAFSSNGSLMYILGLSSNKIFQYSLSTPWQVNTAVNIAAANLAINTGDGGALSAMTFKTDGTIVYTVGTTTDSIFLHNLGTAWNVATAGYSINFTRV